MLRGRNRLLGGVVIIYLCKRGGGYEELLVRTVALPALFAAGPAMGQGLPASPYNWTGFYLGVNVAPIGRGRMRRPPPPIPPRQDLRVPTSLALTFPIIDGIGSGSMTGSGFTGGAQAGYNWQFNSVVVGLEADFGAFRIKKITNSHRICTCGVGGDPDHNVVG